MTWAWIAFALAAIVCIVALPRYRRAVIVFLVLVSITEIYVWLTRHEIGDSVAGARPGAAVAPKKKQLKYASRTVVRKSDVEIESLAVKPVFGKLYLVTALLKNGSGHAVRKLSIRVKVYYCRRPSEDFAGCGFLESQTAEFDSDRALIEAGASRTVRANVYLNAVPRFKNRLKFAYEISEIEAAVLPN
ncbi:MAG: hypothetical protein ACR2PO_18520 [Methyloligellaceae bacterium]